MTNDPRTRDPKPPGFDREAPDRGDQTEVLDPNDSNLLRDRIRGQTDEHSLPPRLEDEGQLGG